MSPKRWCPGQGPHRDGRHHQAPHQGGRRRVPSGLPAGGLRGARALHGPPCRHRSGTLPSFNIAMHLTFAKVRRRMCSRTRHSRPTLNSTSSRAALQVLHSTRGTDGSAAPVEFNTGMDEVPEAVDMAVRLMTPQETSLVSAAARYAYDGRSDRPEVILSGHCCARPSHYSC